jgi:NTP pyrophosphatase (non-canonical NTP hydrolase)
LTAELVEALVGLQELTERLRRDCPWDREQTAQTIVPHTLEEAYEVADAAIGGDDAKLLDEVGDLLFQCYFLALLLQERGQGDRLGLGALVRVLLAHAHDGAQRLDVVAVTLGFGEDVADVVGDRLLLFLQPLDALDDGLELVLGKFRRGLVVADGGGGGHLGTPNGTGKTR